MSSLELSDSIRNGWPLHPQHVGQQRLGDVQGLAIVAVKHHEQPTGEPLLEAMRTIASCRDQELFKESLHVSVHEISKGWH